ncbi:Rv3654c family TadE-like protein [Aeromicrobium sp. UC242_57]|uniref:Rv3654c family TadE-like protein n=1 Tax=Aeromicrobium sp. UC242_57 TaxID=3374624 RepID=UPI00378729CF
MNAADERGAVAVHAVWIAFALIVATWVAVQATQPSRLSHRVASAADLAALAGSQASARGDDGCAAARSVARRNHARLVACRMDLDVATVRARAASPTWWEERWVSEQKARAAPAEYVPARSP